MAEVRSLLRQQRESRRIVHPNAFYSDNGKLLCTLCREQVRSETQWNDHVTSLSHISKEKNQNLPQSSSAGSLRSTGSTGGKRKLDDDDEDYEGGAESSAEARDRSQGEDLVGDARRKRSRPNIEVAIETDAPASLTAKSKDSTPRNGTPPQPQSKHSTPPSLTRRASNTPSQGVEMQIPSRPATPHQGNGHQSVGQFSHKRDSSVTTNLVRNGSSTALQGATNTVTASVTVDKPPRERDPKADVDEDEWAAFQADISAIPAAYDPAATNAAYDDATISALPMSASEIALQKEKQLDQSVEETTEQFRQKEGKQRADEKEEAERALELEFEEMEELESRVKRLKERREELRRNSSAGEGKPPSARVSTGAVGDVEVDGVEAQDALKQDEEESSSDEDEDEWDGFSFRGG